MGLIDKNMLNKVKDAVKGRSETISKSIDSGVQKIDERTGGKYRDKLSQGAEKLKDATQKLDPEAAASPSAADDAAAPRQDGVDTDPDGSEDPESS